MYKFFYNSSSADEKRRTQSESSEDDYEHGGRCRTDSIDFPARIPTRKRILSASRVVGLTSGSGFRGRSKNKDVIRRWNSFHSTRAHSTECHPNRFKNPRRAKSPFRNTQVESLFEHREIPLIDDDEVLDKESRYDETLMHIVENHKLIDKSENITTPSKSWALRRGQSLADRLIVGTSQSAVSAQRRQTLSWYV